MLGYNFQSDDLHHIEKASLFYHRLIESFKFAFAKRSQLGDPFTHNLTQVTLFSLIRISFFFCLVNS